MGKVNRTFAEDTVSVIQCNLFKEQKLPFQDFLI